MKMIRSGSRFGIVLLLLLCTTPLAAQENQRKAKGATPSGPSGKVYTYKESGGQPRQMEIYFPPQHDPKTAKVPGLILFHGGGWTGGSLAQFRTVCDYFAGRGLVTATVQYRMLTKAEAAALPAGETRKRVCITDAKSAIRWFKQHANELGVDPSRVITGGGSAGGHISVLATTNPGLNDPHDPPGIDTTVVAYLLFNPAFSPDDGQDQEVDVLRHAEPTLPPAIVFFGTNDPWKKGWDTLYGKLVREGNKTIDLQIAKNQAHGFFNRDPWQTVCILAADRFLVDQGLLQGTATRTPPPSGEQLTRQKDG